MHADFAVRSDHSLAAGSGIQLSDAPEFPLAGPARIRWTNTCIGAPGNAFICGNLHITMRVVSRSDVVWITEVVLIGSEPNSPLIAPGSAFAQSDVIVGRQRGRARTSLAGQIITSCQKCLSS